MDPGCEVMVSVVEPRIGLWGTLKTRFRSAGLKVFSLAGCGNLESGVPDQVSSSSLDRGSNPSPIVLVSFRSVTFINDGSIFNDQNVQDHPPSLDHWGYTDSFMGRIYILKNA
ncbi:hypothetical protein TNCV_2280981 [Trichonephila clavipes]|nr:hypothetical protein TNCV_2280981 [Trichonephila clavipes]